MHERDISEQFLPNGAVDGIVELHSERERAIWDRAQMDAQEFLRGSSVRQGYSVREVRMPMLVPTLDEVTVFFRRAKINMGPFSVDEAGLYSQSFRLGCQTGYPQKDN